MVGSGPAAVEVARLLRQSGVEVRRDETISSGVDLVVCAPAPAELPRTFGGWNQEALAGAGQAWLQVLPFDGRYAAIGLLYLPDDTALLRVLSAPSGYSNLEAAEELDLLEASPAAYPALPAFQALVAGFAATP